MGISRQRNLAPARPPFDRYGDDLYLSRRLRGHELPENLSNTVDLTAELEEPLDVCNHPGYICVPILDGAVPTIGELRDWLQRLRPGKTLVHCAMGHGRTGLFAVAMLIESRRAESVSDAIAKLQSVQPGIGLSATQRAFAERYCDLILADRGENRSYGAARDATAATSHSDE